MLYNSFVTTHQYHYSHNSNIIFVMSILNSTITSSNLAHVIAKIIVIQMSEHLLHLDGPKVALNPSVYIPHTLILSYY